MSKKTLIPLERIQKKILLLRGQKVLLDSDLAELYGVTTFNLNKAMSRNKDRFPEDFMFQLTNQEFRDLKFHFGISSEWGGRRITPYVFTEQGVAMLSSVLRSKVAVLVNIQIMRSFVKLRELLQSSEVFQRRFEAIERQIDAQGQAIMSIMKELESRKPLPKRREIGFGTG